MRTFAKWLVLLILSLVAVLVLALLIIPSSIVEHRFNTYEQAAASGAFERQALPDHLPRSATDIHSTRDLDNGGEVVTFEYGSDFDRFIAAQVAAPPRTARSLRLRLWDDHFTNPDELVYMPNVSLYKDSRPGTLLVNRVRRAAVYVD
ncbi:hypothetical protein LK540_18145 [Massilia sp. IC2-278]|uniref:hypothetical protein n=1 Tax=Massilia sp. IC2-278 TaxID=2887200 RepID=UPI001E514C1F|nr:hypothetical protein [Massilia sp. IC2-278]MCC2962351.1 hypothetical protein [Massilia sp. IC2-278]